MPVGTPDFDSNLTDDKTAQVIDPGEMAGRINRGMGSMIRSGSVIFADDFENYTAGQYSLINGLATFAVDPTTVCRPGAKQSLKLSTTGGGACAIQRRIPSLTDGGIASIEFYYQMNPVYTPNNFMEVMLYTYNEARTLNLRFQAKVRNLNPNTVLDLFNSSGAYAIAVNPLEIKKVTPGVNNVHFFKMVVDSETRTYKHIYIDYLRFDFPSFLCDDTPETTGAHAGIQLQIGVSDSSGVAGTTLNINDLIVTQNEI